MKKGENFNFDSSHVNSQFNKFFRREKIFWSCRFHGNLMQLVRSIATPWLIYCKPNLTNRGTSSRHFEINMLYIEPSKIKWNLTINLAILYALYLFILIYTLLRTTKMNFRKPSDIPDTNIYFNLMDI